MCLHELPLVCVRLTCASGLETWASVASFVVRSRGLQSLVMCQCEGSLDDDDDDNGGGDDRQALPWNAMAGADGTGAEECARAVLCCLRMRGGAMETIVWRGEVDGWRL
jgi:hypothetical protein